MSYSGASVDAPRVSSEFASGRGGWDQQGGIVRENIPVVIAHADVVINVGALQATGITIQFNYPDGTAIKKPQDFDLYVVSLTNGMISSLAATGGNVGIAIGSNGFIANTALAKKMFKCWTGPTGLWSGTWGDNAAEVAYLAVVLPSGRHVLSAQLPTS